MKKLYFVFDQLPDIKEGGLISSYINLYNLLKEKYEIHIISVFNFEKNTTTFDNNRIHIINNYKIDNRFYKFFSYIKSLKFKKVGKSILSLFIYFLSIHMNRKRIKKILKDEDLVIVSCPSAGIFMHKSIKFILEIHTSYKYFFGNNFLGKLQGKMMTKPTLTLFRTKYDSENVPKYLNPDYIYNFFDNKDTKRSKTLIKNKICFVGRIEDVKDPLRLITIANDLRKINKNFILDIYGDGSLLNDCKKKIEELNLKNIVNMKGFTTNKNIYSKYTLQLVTSKYEGLPMSIIEAKANGIPTISNVWGESVKEVINNKVDGFIVNDNEEYVKKINEVLTNEELQKKLSENAYKSYNTFSKKEALKKWLYFLENYKK
ncbi:MAG: glycosyltransferase [Bacilli bacterium]|nr:glycosyltransferase [Bacilli bacterium]